MKNKSFHFLLISTFSLVFILLISLISFVFDFGVSHSKYDQTGKVNLIMNHTIDPEIIVFGSSVGEVGLNSKILSTKTKKRVYNCSIDGTPYIQYKGLINEFNSYSKVNKYVIFMESYFSLQKLQAVSVADRYLAHIQNPNIYSALYYLQPELIWKCRYIPFYKYVATSHIYYKNCLLGIKDYLQKNKSTDSLEGFRPVYREWEIDQDEILKSMKPFKIKTDPEVVTKYITTINEMKKNNKEIIIVLPPIYFELSQRLTDFSPIRQTLDSISKITGARFIDFSSSDICSQKEYFYNTNHLNFHGAQIFTTRLADSLSTIFVQ